MGLAFPVSIQCVSRLVLPRSSSDSENTSLYRCSSWATSSRSPSVSPSELRSQSCVSRSGSVSPYVSTSLSVCSTSLGEHCESTPGSSNSAILVTGLAIATTV